MIAKITVTLKSGVLDPQGKTVQKSLNTLGFDQIEDVRVGKYIEVRLKKTVSKTAAQRQVEIICKKLLANEVIEDFHYDLLEA